MGEALIHRCPWPTTGTATYGEICNMYCRYVKRKYQQPVIVFDGYSTVTTKSMTQKRRSGNKIASTVTFTEDMKATIKKRAISGKRKKQGAAHLDAAPKPESERVLYFAGRG